MKPSFALDLRSSVIALLHRTSRGWTKVGDASLEAPDFGEALAFMRSTALGLSPRGITTKLILPNAQILYTKVTAPVAEPWTRTRRIGAALEGLTPYRLDELAYDWCETATGVQVAVVAKETLEEAETFARDHRFNPVCFVAVPEAGTFLGEPLFGQSRLSKSILAKDETVERDSDAVRVVGRDAPKAKASAATPPTVDVDQAASAKTNAPAVAVAVLDPVPAVDASNDPPPATTSKALPAPILGPFREAEAAKPAIAEPATVEPATVEPAAVESAQVKTAPVESAPVESVLAKAGPPDSAQAVVREPSPAQSLNGAAAVPQEPVVPPDQAPASKAEAPEAPMLVDVDSDNDDPRPNNDPKPSPALKKGAPVAASAKAKAPRDARLQALGPSPTARAGATRTGVARPAAAKPLPKTIAIARPSAALPWQPLPVNPAKGRSRSAVALAGTRTALGRITGARDGVTPKQRRFVILVVTTVLVALLGAVAIWASLSLGTNEAQNSTPAPAPATGLSDDSTAAITASQSTTPKTTSSQVPSAQDEALADRQSVDAADAGVPLTPPDGPTPTAALVAENIPTASALSSGKDGIFPTGVDTPPVSQDPIALPDLQGAADTPPILPPSPPPYGANLALQPSPVNPPALSEDVMAPAGDLSLAGKPATAPPARPKDLVPSVAIEEAVVVQDPSLAGKRPLERPVDLVPVTNAPTAPENVAPESRFASLRPQARPADLTTSSPASKAPLAEGFALASSPIPPARPADVSKGIDDALAVALNQAPTEDQPAPELPVAEPEAEVETLAPTLPTNVSVAKQATEVNALKTNRVALLGIFGTQANRYAMIRMMSGQVKKVQMGDSVEGGRIAGITSDAVKYQKGNRIITLSMP